MTTVPSKVNGQCPYTSEGTIRYLCCCCVQGCLHFLRCHMDHPHRWPRFRLRFVLIMQRDKVLKIGMPFNQGESCLPQGCIGSRGSQSEAVSSYPCVAEAQPETIKQIFLSFLPPCSSPYPLGQPQRQILRTHLAGMMTLLKVIVMTTWQSWQCPSFLF